MAKHVDDHTWKMLADEYRSFWLFQHRERAAGLAVIAVAMVTMGILLTSVAGIDIDGASRIVAFIGTVAIIAAPLFHRMPVGSWLGSVLPHISFRARVVAFAASVVILILGPLPASLLQAAIADKRLREVANGEITPRHEEALKEIARSGIRVDKGLVSRAAARVPAPTESRIEWTSYKRSEWAVLMDLAGIASNFESIPSLPPPFVASRLWDTKIHLPKNYDDRPKASRFGRTTPDLAARHERIGERLNADFAFGPEYIVELGQGVDLDESDIQHVIFEQVHIEYHGGPLRMIDARFINCTFTFSETPTSYALTQMIIRGGPVSIDVRELPRAPQE
jgi:hypothetical protein